jgi:hypothetical protein
MLIHLPSATPSSTPANNTVTRELWSKAIRLNLHTVSFIYMLLQQHMSLACLSACHHGWRLGADSTILCVLRKYMMLFSREGVNRLLLDISVNQLNSWILPCQHHLSVSFQHVEIAHVVWILSADSYLQWSCNSPKIQSPPVRHRKQILPRGTVRCSWWREGWSGHSSVRLLGRSQRGRPAPQCCQIYIPMKAR